MRENSVIKQNIIQYLDFKGISKYEFYQKTGVSNGVLSQSSGMSEENTMRFLSYYDDVNPEWLLTGKGEMLRTKSIENLTIIKGKEKGKEKGNKPNMQKTLPNIGVPLIPIDAMAGFGTGAVQVMDYDTQTYIVPEFTELNVDFMIRVKGSSMYPKYNSGDLVACKKLCMQDMFFQWNKVYVLDTEQGAIIKRIKKGEDQEHILLISENVNYDPFELHISKIFAIALVVGVIRLE